MAQDTTTPTDEPGAPERAPGASPSHPHPHLRRVFLGAAATASAFVMVIAAVTMGTYFWARGQIHTIPPINEPGQQSPTTEDIAGKCAERACNYLLLGSDSRQGRYRSPTG